MVQLWRLKRHHLPRFAAVLLFLFHSLKFFFTCAVSRVFGIFCRRSYCLPQWLKLKGLFSRTTIEHQCKLILYVVEYYLPICKLNKVIKSDIYSVLFHNIIKILPERVSYDGKWVHNQGSIFF